MPRRRSESALDLLLEMAVLLPWWVDIIVAAVIYGVLHHYAVADVPTTLTPPQVGQTVSGMIVQMFASCGQYLFPILFLFGAIASFFRRRHRIGLWHNAQRGDDDTIRSLSWHDFELLVGEAFRRRGFSVSETGGGGADDGVDLQLRKNGETFLVQCKQWRAYRVSVTVVRELYGIMAAHGAAGGFVVTSGVFTTEARAFAKGRNIELLDGTALHAMIESTQGARVGTLLSSAQITQEVPHEGLPTGNHPICPRCGHAMVKRTATRGAHAGRDFWGCTQFPKCRGTQSIE